MTDSANPINFASENWDELKTRLKKIFTALTDSDLDYGESKKEEMMEKLQVKLGKSKKELNDIFEIL
jgi:uncharacterized protein YjbJ (UPF0337 family)